MIKWVITLCSLYQIPTIAAEPALAPQEALAKLMKGNDRYAHDRLQRRHNQDRRLSVHCKQTPFAIILSCSDSRVSPEIIFDQGIGDIFVVRVAGNVVGSLELDSIEFAASVLKAAVIMVVGHENCGAIAAVLEDKAQSIPTIAELITPSVEKTKASSGENLLKRATQLNAMRMRDLLLKSPILSELVQEEKLAVYAAYYHLQKGTVELLQN